jgi:hypothetical protein
MVHLLPEKFINKFTKILFSLFFILSLIFSSFINTIYADETLTITAQVGSTPVTPPVSGGGGAVLLPSTAVRFSGYAYPDANVYLLKEGKEETQVQADALGAFNITLPEEYDSTILYTLYAVDKSFNKSLLLNYPIVIYEGFVTHLSGIRFAPTVFVDKTEVNFADSIIVSGYATPNANLEIIITKKGGDSNAVEKKTFNLLSSQDGSYNLDISVLGFAKGEYTLYVKYKEEVKFSKTITFIVGEVSKLNTDGDNIPGDCNFDRIINLVDFSILAFWYKKPNPPVCVDTNKDDIIDLIDFSILAFYWTG